MPIFPLRYRSHASYHDAPRSFGYTRQNSVRSHPGVDLYAPAGLEILAMADGVVVDAPGHFNCGTEAVEIRHAFGTVRYCEIQPGSPLKRGDRVREGQVTDHRLKAVAPVTGCKPCSGQRPAKWVPHQAGFKK